MSAEIMSAEIVSTETMPRPESADTVTGSESTRAGCQALPGGSLVLLRDAHPALVAQQGFVRDRDAVLLRSGVSGQRLVTALHLVLTTHRPEASAAIDGAVHLRCRTCRPADRTPSEQYPCLTAQQAFWALDAVLG